MMRGEVAVSGRVGRERLWDLPERVYPADVVIPPVDEAHRIRNERRLVSLGIARKKSTTMPLEPVDVGEAGEPAVVEGVKGEWRVDPAALDDDFEGRTALLSPFDRSIYDRVRAVELFDFEYTLEMYKPAAKRRWGYFALPVLHGDRLVGKVDAVADRKASVLRVNAIHEDVKFTRTIDEGRAVGAGGPCLVARTGCLVVRGLVAGVGPLAVVPRLERDRQAVDALALDRVDLEAQAVVRHLVARARPRGRAAPKTKPATVW